MGTDIWKVTYSDSWRPSQKFLDWVLDRLNYEYRTGIFFVPDSKEFGERIEELMGEVPEEFKAELEKLFRDYGGYDIAVG